MLDMMQTEQGKFTKEDRDYLEREIKELEAKISAHYTEMAKQYGEDALMFTSWEALQWNKELRRLRRLRNG
jgi:hypothetical protein